MKNNGLAGIIGRQWVEAATLGLLLAVSLASAQTAPRVPLTGQRPAVVPQLQPLGRLAATNRLKLSINLPLHNREALTNLLEQLYDPASPQYHHYLTADQFDAHFGPTDQDYQAVIDFAIKSGFTITTRHPNRMLLEVSALVPDIERAFQVNLRTYAHPTEARGFYAPDSEPLLDSTLPVANIGGLDGFARAHPQNFRRTVLKKPAKASPQTVGSGPNGNLAGFDFRAAYVPGVALTGKGQSVGLLEFDGYYPGDIISYENHTGVTNVPLSIILLDGFNGVPTTGPYSGNGEVALDIEMAISMAPGLSQVVVFEADPVSGLFSDLLQAMSTNTLIKQFSSSWAVGPISVSERTAIHNYCMKLASQGQSFFNASGDSGAVSGPFYDPQDDPYVTMVGGTTLATAGPGGAWLSETVWNAQAGPGLAGTGGGISTRYGIPSWQQGVPMTNNHGSTVHRNVPDVAMVADNIFIVADNGLLESTGGTSAAAPLWAGFTALANEKAAAAGQSSVGFLNPALYNIGTNSSYAACFDDITVGNNTNGDANLFIAVPGYDLCTGWGSPAGGSLLLALTQPDGFQITPGRGAVANGPAGGPFTWSTQTLILTDSGQSNLNWSLASTSIWLNVSSRAGALTAGGGTRSVSVAINAAANVLPAGVYTANLWFTNLTSGLVQLRQFTLQVGQDLVQDGGFEAGDFCYWTLEGGSDIYTNNFVDNGSYTLYPPYAGNFFAALGQVSALAYLSQPLPTRAGQLYSISLRLENVSGQTPNEFQVRWDTNNSSANVIYDQTDLGVSGYTHHQFVVEASTNVTTLRFGFRNDNDFLALDNVSVLPVPLPALQRPVVANGSVQLAWAAFPGLNYTVEYKTNLAQANWIILGGTLSATSNPMTFSDTPVPATGRFYRVRLLP